MTDVDQALADKLRDVYAAFEKDGDAALERLAPLYAAEMVFRDPLQTLHGRDAFMAMNRRIMGRAARLSFEVTDAVGARGAIFLAWTMVFEPRRGPRVVFAGATHLRQVNGLITEQRDYWDLLSSFAASVPLLRSLYAALAPHLG
jgi:limonene-1,2-epoxide hydrolase